MVDTTLPLRQYKKKSKSYVRKVIARLVERAQETKELDKAHALTRRAKKISLATKVRFLPHIKRMICKSCGAFLGSEKSATVRTQRGKVVTTCRECKQMMRVPYKK